MSSPRTSGRLSGPELLQRARAEVREVEPGEVRDRLASAGAENGRGVALVDVREQHEFEERHIEGARHVPRGHLESRIETAVPDRSQSVVLYCSSGNRSAFAARTLQDMGYEDVASMAGGITLWRDRGLPVVTPRRLSDDQKERYSRHLLIPEVGVEGQLALLDAKVLLLGAGGLGSPTALYLAAAGVGTLGLVDDDEVDASNLQRQVIHTTDRIGVAKTESARLTIEALNPDVEVVEHRTRLDSGNVLELLRDYDVIVDGADNFPTRYLLNDASVRLRKPVVSASILGFDGQISTFVPFEGPCYRCLYPTPPPAELAPSCGAAGVLGILPGVMGLLQANEVVKLIIGKGEPLVGRLLLFEALETRFTELKVKRDPSCPICGEDAAEVSDAELGKFPDYEAFCAGTASG